MGDDRKALEEAIAQMKSEVGAETDKQLSEFLKIDPSAIAAWRRRKKIPEKYQLRFMQKSGDAVLRNARRFIRDSYSFALIGIAAEQLRTRVRSVDDEEAKDVWVGLRLARLSRFLTSEFSQKAYEEEDAAKELFRTLRTQIGQRDVDLWIETLQE